MWGLDKNPQKWDSSCLQDQCFPPIRLRYFTEVNWPRGTGKTPYRDKAILYFRIPHNTLCLPPQILHKPLFLNAPGSIAFSQEHFKTISYAKFGGQTQCIMGNSKIVNREEKCDVTLPWKHYFWMTTKPTTTATARRTAKNNMFILTNNNFARASRYFVHFFAVVAPLRHETS